MRGKECSGQMDDTKRRDSQGTGEFNPPEEEGNDPHHGCPGNKK